MDEEDDIASDVDVEQEEAEAEGEDDDDVASPGKLVWVKWGRFRYPARVILLSEVPDNLQSCLRKASPSSVVVKFYGSGDFSRVETKKLSI